MPALRDALDRLAARLPQPDPAAPVRLWVDRAFQIRGSGTVVTGTLPAGTIREKQELLLTPSMDAVRVRGIETLKQQAGQVSGVARVALNLRGAERVTPARGMALVEPGRWTLAATPGRAAGRGRGPPAAAAHRARRVGADRRPAAAAGRPDRPAHPGRAAAAARRRPVAAPRPGVGRGGLRPAGRRAPDPARATSLVTGWSSGPGGLAAAGRRHGAGRRPARVPPPGCRRRGRPGPRGLARRARPRPTCCGGMGCCAPADLRAMGLPELPAPVGGDWLADPEHWADAAPAAHREASRRTQPAEPLAPGLPLEAARAGLGLPDRQLVERAGRAPAGRAGRLPVLERDGGHGQAARPCPEPGARGGAAAP